MAITIIVPPIKVFKLGTSLIPKIGSQTQKIPPKTSVRERRVRSAAGKYLALAEYIIRAEQTKKPCNDESEVFLSDTKILISLKYKTKRDISAAKIPPIETVVNFGTFFFHLRETVKHANAEQEIKPLIKPNNVPVSLLS